MAERALARKSQLFLASVLPVIDTHEEVVKKKLKRGKFLFTYTAFFKIVALILMVTGLGLFAATSKCLETPSWYPYLFPVTTGIAAFVCCSTFLVFSFGLTVKNPDLWIKTDIIGCLVLSIMAIVCAIISLHACIKATSLQKIPEPVSLVGCALMIISCASLFLLYRYREEEDETDNVKNKPKVNRLPRKSIFA